MMLCDRCKKETGKLYNLTKYKGVFTLTDALSGSAHYNYRDYLDKVCKDCLIAGWIKKALLVSPIFIMGLILSLRSSGSEMWKANLVFLGVFLAFFSVMEYGMYRVMMDNEKQAAQKREKGKEKPGASGKDDVS